MSRKLIEVSLPLEAINAESAREKSIRHGHPSTLHLWWARRPLAAARAVIWSSLVDDPSSHPEEFPTEEAQNAERQRLFGILERLVKWENSNNQEVLAEAKAEIMKSTGGNPPALLDPFAGGGAIPLEAQRLGLEAYASDLNPVAVMINKAMIEIPPKFAGQPPVNPESRQKIAFWEIENRSNDHDISGTDGLAKSNGYSARDLPLGAKTAERGNLRNEIANNKGGSFDTVQHRGRMGQRVGQGENAISCDSARFTGGTRHSTDTVRRPELVSENRNGKSTSFACRDRKDVDCSTSEVPEIESSQEQEIENSQGRKNSNKNRLPISSQLFPGSTGLAEDVRYYGEWMKKEAFKRIGHLYPKIEISKKELVNSGYPDAQLLPASSQLLTIIAWIWARTVKCPNPACGCEMPLASSFELSKKKGKEAYIQPIISKTGNAGTGILPANPPALPKTGWHSRGYLPHFDTPGAIQFITFRLYDSVPIDIINQWKNELGIAGKQNLPADDKRAIKLREMIEKYEASGRGACYLRRDDIAAIIQNTLLHFDDARYSLLEWCVMPNHVHVLIATREGYALSDVIHSWKSFTANQANKLLRREGHFWMPEYYDRYIRDDRHYEAVVEYIHNNPVRSGLAGKPEEWQWGSAYYRKKYFDECKCRQDARAPSIRDEYKCRQDARTPSIRDECKCRQDARAPSIRYEVRYGKNAPEAPKTARGRFKCVCCGTPVTGDYIKTEGQAKRIGAQLMAIVAEGNNGRLYISPNDEQIESAACSMPEWKPDGEMFGKSADQLPLYGYKNFWELFTNRQLTALTTFSDLVAEARVQVEKDGGSREYANAVGVYLAFAVDKGANYWSTCCAWHKSAEKMMSTFGRQAIPMVWDYTEANPFSESSGNWTLGITQAAEMCEKLGVGCHATVSQFDAQTDNGLRNIMVSTDPPYYDNIGYADLSDFFYIWMRHSLKNIYPELFRTMLVPKTEELVATPYRFEGNRNKARKFFEDGMVKTFKQIYIYAIDGVPVTVYYAYKQSEDDDSTNTASTGWETMLSAMIQAGFTIQGTWPVRTELTTALKGNANALASSIVLVCRKRIENSEKEIENSEEKLLTTSLKLFSNTCTRRDFINTLKRELKPALQKLQASNIAPVDLAQSAIGPGMGVYSRFSKVLEADGTPMSVRSALQIINQELDLYFTEQDGELDSDSRFCVALYTQYAFNNMKFGEADVLARAKNTSVEKLRAAGVLYAEKGVMRLLTREELGAWASSPHISRQSGQDARAPSPNIIWLLTQQLTRAMEKDGVVGAAQIVADIFTSEPEQAKALAYRLFQIAERKAWTGEAYAYNSLVIAWPEVQSKAADLSASRNGEQMSMFDEEDK